VAVGVIADAARRPLDDTPLSQVASTRNLTVGGVGYLSVVPIRRLRWAETAETVRSGLVGGQGARSLQRGSR